MNIQADQDQIVFKRMGGQPECVHWLLDFMQMELSELPKGRMEDLCREIRIFSLYGWIDKEAKDNLQNNLDLLFPPALYLYDLYNYLFKNFDVVIDLQNILKTWVFEILKKQKISYQPLSIQISVIPLNEKFWTLKTIGGKIPSKASIKDAFLFNSLNALAKYASKIKSCIQCQNIYLAWKYSQNYCSTRCLGRATQANFRTKKKLKKRKPLSKKRD